MISFIFIVSVVYFHLGNCCWNRIHLNQLALALLKKAFCIEIIYFVHQFLIEIAKRVR